MADQLECRVVVVEYESSQTFSLGMYDPRSGSYADLGTHPMRDRKRVIRDLKNRIEREGHRLSLSVQSKR